MNKNKKTKLDPYIAKYFLNIRKIAKQTNSNIITMQWFQWKNNVVLAGVKYILELLKKHTNIKSLKIKYLKDGSIINSYDPVLEIEGFWHDFGWLEGMIDGILSRASSIATSTRKIVEKANNKKVINMGDRADYYLNQELDGYASFIGGIKTLVTKKQVIGSRQKIKAIGTISHSYIQMFNNDLIQALENFQKIFPKLDLYALVDFNGDAINDSLKVLKHFKKKLYAVVLDHSDKIIDKYFENKKRKIYGVNPILIKALRKELDKNQGKHVKIVVSGGLTPEKIENFEKEKTPIDIYGVGQYIFEQNKTYFTGDAVKINKKELAKLGRKYQINRRLKNYKI